MLRDNTSLAQQFFLVAIAALHLLYQQAKAEYLHKYPFLYATVDDVNASFPVIEHLSQEYRGDIQASYIDKDEEDRPDFLYNHEEQGYRIVEYYVHWCSTCKLFASVYRSFAIKIKELAAHQGIENNLNIYAVSCSPNRKLCVDQNVKGFPKIRLYKPGASEFIELAHHHHLHPLRVLDSLGIDSDGIQGGDIVDEDWYKNSVAIRSGHSEAPSSKSYWKEVLSFFTQRTNTHNTGTSVDHGKYNRRTRGDLKSDIYLSFDYAMRNEIYRSTGALSEVQQKVLHDWLILLGQTLPSSWEIHKLLQELMNNFVYIVKSEDYLMALLDEYPAPEQDWSLSCSYGVPDEGYTCGLWELFHTVTVGLVEYNKATFDPSSLLVTEKTARILRDYVDLFFGCHTCRENFLEMFDKCSFNRCDRLADYPIEDENDWVELTLWLHETHDHVNIRLLKEKAARDRKVVSNLDIGKVRWPSQQDCSACWKNDSSSDDPNEFPWLSDKLFKFLRLEYGSRDAFTADLRRELNPASITPMLGEVPASPSIPSLPYSAKRPIFRIRPEAPLFIQLSHASMFIALIVLMSAAASTRRHRQLKLKVS